MPHLLRGVHEGAGSSEGEKGIDVPQLVQVGQLAEAGVNVMQVTHALAAGTAVQWAWAAAGGGGREGPAVRLSTLLIDVPDHVASDAGTTTTLTVRGPVRTVLIGEVMAQL